MAVGGDFLTHNKVLPGAYINFVSKAKALDVVAGRGICTLAFKNNWGENDEIISITSEEFQKDAIKIFGYSYNHEKLKPIREIFKNARELKLFRLSKGTKAAATITASNFTVTAKYRGTLGNSIKVKINKAVNQGGSTILTYIESLLVYEQFVEDGEKPKDNDFICFTGTYTTLPQTAGLTLANASDESGTKEQYIKYLELIEKENFNTIIYDEEDEITKGLFENFVKRLRIDEGVKITCVMHNYNKANFEGIVSIKNSKNLVYWVGGALAGAMINESLTNKIYNGEYLFDMKYSNSELKDTIKEGHIVFYFDDKDIKILKDINTFTGFTPEKNKDFSNNQIIRILDTTANDIARIFDDFYLGKVQNHDMGRDMFKSEILNYFNTLKSIDAITNFSSKDIIIEKGNQKGDVIVYVNIQPVASMDKIYMKCIVE